MKIMNADGTYSHHSSLRTHCISHAIGELGYLSSFPLNNVGCVTHNCIKNIRCTNKIIPADKQFLIHLIKHTDYEQAKLGILKILANE